jgi:hypothetical protein
VGVVCFDRRFGLLDSTPTQEGERFIQTVGQALLLTQKELELLPLYRYIPTPIFRQFTSAWNFIRQ